MAEEESYYKILEVSKNASPEELKSQKKKLSMRYHPDKLSGKSEAIRKQGEERFKQINEAYEVLSDPEKRKLYDKYGKEGLQKGPKGPFGSFDPFGEESQTRIAPVKFKVE